MTGSHPAGSADTDSPKGRRGSYRAGFFFGTLSFAVAIGLGGLLLTGRLRPRDVPVSVLALSPASPPS